jgi:hypothetical protein
VPRTESAPSKRVFGIALTALAALLSLSVAVPQPQAKRSPRRAAVCQRFASPRGEDSNRGTRKSPFESAERLARALKPGQTGCLFSGVYRRDVHLKGAGRQGARLSLRAVPGARVTLCGFVVFVDLTNRHLGPSCVLIGFHDWQPRGVRIDHDRIHDCGHSGSHWDHGIYAARLRDARISDNYVYGSAGFGIHLYDDAQSTLVQRNVVDDSGTESGLVFGGSANVASSHNLVRQNIFSSNAKWGAKSYWEGPIGVDNVLETNCFWRNGFGAVPSKRIGFVARRNIEADPQFVAAAVGDYRLSPRSRCAKMQPRGHVGP